MFDAPISIEGLLLELAETRIKLQSYEFNLAAARLLLLTILEDASSPPWILESIAALLKDAP